MKHRLPPLDGLKVFEAAARHLSFSLAAQELCITKGAVSYQIRKLETHLQCALFKRSVRQVLLTDAGQMLLQSTQQIFETLEESLARLEGESHHSSVTVAATTYVAARWLSGHISAFNEQCPDVNIVLQHSVNSADFKLSEVDLAIRWTRCEQSSDRPRLAEMTMPLYPAISPQLLQRCGIHPTEKLSADAFLQPPFSELVLLIEGRQQDLWQEWIDAGSVGNGPVRLSNPRRIVSDANVKVQAAIDGQGLILADDLMHSEFSNELLVSPFNHTLNGYGYALLQQQQQFISTQALALKNWLVAQVKAG